MILILATSSCFRENWFLMVLAVVKRLVPDGYHVITMPILGFQMWHSIQSFSVTNDRFGVQPDSTLPINLTNKSHFKELALECFGDSLIQITGTKGKVVEHRLAEPKLMYGVVMRLVTFQIVHQVLYYKLYVLIHIKV